MNPYEQYMEAAVLTATPVELVRMLYRCAIDCLDEATFCLRAGDVSGRAKPVTKALDALTELLLSLDHTKGGAIASNLASLYGYMQNRVLDGHCQQAEAPFVEVRELLSTLLQSWEQIEPERPRVETKVQESYSFAG